MVRDVVHKCLRQVGSVCASANIWQIEGVMLEVWAHAERRWAKRGRVAWSYARMRTHDSHDMTVVDVSRQWLTTHTMDATESNDKYMQALVCSIYVCCFSLDLQCSNLFDGCTKEWTLSVCDDCWPGMIQRRAEGWEKVVGGRTWGGAWWKGKIFEGTWKKIPIILLASH